ncbi:MAG: hypothetical protein V7K67_01220, partial [Nostoc sp.]
MVAVIISFQSLIGILVDCNGSIEPDVTFTKVSIPNNPSCVLGDSGCEAPGESCDRTKTLRLRQI